MGNTNNLEDNNLNRNTDPNTSKDIEIIQKRNSKSNTKISNNKILDNPQIESISSSLESSEDNNESSSVYEIEKIVSRRYNKKLNQMEYLIKWKGYSENENTWENEQNLTNEVIEEYKNRLDENEYEKDSIKINSENIESKTKIDKDAEIMNELVHSIGKIERNAKTEKIVITNELSEKIQSVIKIVYRDSPVYENIFVVVKIDNEIREFPIKEAEVKFPKQIIRYFNQKSVYN